MQKHSEVFLGRYTNVCLPNFFEHDQYASNNMFLQKMSIKMTINYSAENLENIQMKALTFHRDDFAFTRLRQLELTPFLICCKVKSLFSDLKKIVKTHKKIK